MLGHQLVSFVVLSLALTRLQFVSCEIPAADQCDPGFNLVGDKCLKILSKTLNWYDADRDCHSLGAGLLSLQNEEQLLHISKWINRNVEVWTSGNSLGNQGVYYWQSTGQVAQYLPWATGEPQKTNGNCLTLSYNSGSVTPDFRLKVKSCNYEVWHICEKLTQSGHNLETRVCLKSNAYEMAQVVGN
ncbi:GH19780 [Drosophila grimshawi]|uniref:GH19780 n=1 Tax=Drosophila grimshawi TaxID=7222 RepID=B4J421_DROGR|nr:GH19780 [Drosophila grimshawi]